MERRKAVTAAAATSATLLLGAAGLTANATILGAHDGGGVGKVSPVATVVTTTAAERALAQDASVATTEVPDLLGPGDQPAGEPAADLGAGGTDAGYHAPPAPTPTYPAPTYPTPTYSAPTYQAPVAPPSTIAPAPAPTPTQTHPTTASGASQITSGSSSGEVEDHGTSDDHEDSNGSEADD